MDFHYGIYLLITNIDLKYLFSIDLKSRYDEEKSLREAGDQRVAKLNEQLQKEKEENERVQTELVQHNKFLLAFTLLPYRLKTHFVLCIDCSFTNAML